ncbi:MAG: hypothetical protein HY774_24215 [Acidobacteria bacterium]|nr:hypothetical protein [Acidobacteriota bacterium]
MSPSARTSTAPSLPQICITTIRTAAIDADTPDSPLHGGSPSPPPPTGLEGGFVCGVNPFEKSTHLLLAALTPPVRWRFISTLVARAGYLSMHPGRVFSPA